MSGPSGCGFRSWIFEFGFLFSLDQVLGAWSPSAFSARSISILYPFHHYVIPNKRFTVLSVFERLPGGGIWRCFQLSRTWSDRTS
ncbi:unnamed protein product [Linum trigynum]|uniref:Secreted protein n=1 Tax=Linum trigynum TaxID=586398 RepID=A0AAV2EMB5_9ROSI